MKLILITPGYTPLVQKRGMELARQGIRVWQVACSHQVRQHGRLLAVPTEIADAYRLLPVGIVRPGDPHRGIMLSVLPCLREVRPDVVAIERDPDTMMAWQAAVLRRVWAPSAKLVLHSWQNVSRPLKPHVRAILNHTLRQADYICCANQEAMRVLRRWGYDGLSAEQIWQGVDTSVFYRRDAECLRQRLNLTGQFVLGYVGRLAPEKGLSDLLTAMRDLPSNVHCLVVGGGSEQTALRALTSTLHLSARVHWIGAIPHMELPTYYSAMDVLVLPSRTTPVWKEQFGRVLIEAMACQTPVVGSDSGAIPEVIGPAGQVFAEGNVRALAGCLLSLYRDRSVARELGLKALDRVREKYSTERVATDIARIYKDIARGASTNTPAT